MKNNTPAYILSDSSVTVIIDGRPLTMTNSNSAFPQVVEKIKNKSWDNLADLFDTGKAVSRYTHNSIVVEDNRVVYRGQEIHNHCVDRLLEFMRNGLPTKPLLAFLDKLMLNPSKRAVDELYSFLEHKNMPLTPDGNFLAYKSLRSDWTDHHTGKVSNVIGTVNEMSRNEVCDDANIACFHGYHAGSLIFAQGFGGSDSRLVIVEINPADVVSIPKDADCQKLRCCKYKVVGTFERPLTEVLNTDYSEPESEDNFTDEDFEEFIEESYGTGYEIGADDAASDLPSDSNSAFESYHDDLDEESFVDGYDAGYADNVIVPEPKAKVKTISESTRRKLSKAAKNANRDNSGKFC